MIPGGAEFERIAPLYPQPTMHYGVKAVWQTEKQVIGFTSLVAKSSRFLTDSLLRASLAPHGTPNMNFRNGAFNGQRGIRDDAAYREYVDGSDRGLAIELANRMRDAIQAVRGRAFAVKSSFELCPTAGTSTDYTFSRHLADASKGKAYSYAIEWAAGTTLRHSIRPTARCKTSSVR
jgi:hypothetical protein